MAETAVTPATVRSVEPADFSHWRLLWDAYQQFYGRTATDEMTRFTWRRFLDPAEPMHAVVALDGDRLLGLAHFIFHRNTWMAGDVCYLQDLFTVPDARGRGIATQLIEAVYAAAAQAGSPRVYWLTHDSNATAISLYERMAERSGFVQFRKTLAAF